MEGDRAMRSDHLTGNRDFFLSDENVPELDSEDNCRTLNCTHFKMVKMVNFMFYIFYHNFKKGR